MERIRRAIVAAYTYRLVAPWAAAILGWIVGAAAVRVKSDSIFAQPVVVGVLGGVWLAVAGTFVTVGFPAAASRRVAVAVVVAKAGTIFLFGFSGYLALFFATFDEESLRTAAGKYFLPGPFVALTGFCIGWLLVELVAAAERPENV